MPFKFANLLNKDGRRASTSSNSETRSLDETYQEETDVSPPSKPPVKSQSLQGPVLTVTDEDSTRFDSTPQGGFPHHSPNGVGRLRGNSFDLRVQTDGNRDSFAVPPNVVNPIDPRRFAAQDFDDLDTPIASRSEIDVFAMAGRQVAGGNANVGAVPSRSYAKRQEDNVAPLTEENLTLAPAVDEPLKRVRSDSSSVAPHQTTPLRNVHVAEPPVVVSPPRAAGTTGSATAKPSTNANANTLGPPPESRPRSSSASSQRGAGIAALVSSAASIAGSGASIPALSQQQQQSGHHPHIIDKMKDKVKKRKSKKRRDTDGDRSGVYSNRSSFYSTGGEEGEYDNVSNGNGAGRSRRSTNASMISNKVASGRRIRSNSDASSALQPAGMDDGAFGSSDEDEEDGLSEGSEDEYDDDDDAHSSFMSRGSMSLPVTGFAVASTKRNQDFHALFPEVDEDDYLIEDYGCALQKDILVQGRIYASENHLCFHANIFGWVTNVVIPFTDVVRIEKKMTAFVIPNAICVSTVDAKHTFASFISRDSTYDVFKNIWRQSRPGDGGFSRVMTTESTIERDRDDIGPSTEANGNAAPIASKSKALHGPTTCECGEKGDHYEKIAMDATFASSPEKIHNLMFSSGFVKDFMVKDQHLTDLEMSDWKPVAPGSDLLARSMSYIKPLTAGIGPKQTKCHIVDEADHFDPDRYISMITTTRTPDVPSGNAFSVKTRTCLTWAGANSTKVVVTTDCEWSGKSWVKNIIEKSAVQGQQAYHHDLERSMRAYMKEHASEFAREGAEGETAEEEQEQQAAAEREALETKELDIKAAKEEARRQREEDERNALQWAFDRIVEGGKTLGGGLWSLISTIMDMARDIPLTKETLLGVLILILLLSNIWTYFSLRSERMSDKQALRNARRRESRMSLRQGMSPIEDVADEQIVEAVKAFLGGFPTPKHESDLAGEARQVIAMLEEVERRADVLRAKVTALTVRETGASLEALA